MFSSLWQRRREIDVTSGATFAELGEKLNGLLGQRTVVMDMTGLTVPPDDAAACSSSMLDAHISLGELDAAPEEDDSAEAGNWISLTAGTIATT